MANGTLSPAPVFIGFDNNGVIIPGGLLETFAAGTTTPATTWSDVGLTTPHTNPIVLSSAGRTVIYLDPTASYKFILKTAAGVVVWSQDNIQAIASSAQNTDITGTAGENISAGAGVYLSDGSGGRTAGRWYMTDSTNAYSSSLAPQTAMAQTAITSGSPGSIRINGQITGLAGLTPGLLYYASNTPGALTSTAPTNERPIATADSSTSAVVFVAGEAASGTNGGLITSVSQSIKGTKLFTSMPGFYAGTQSTLRGDTLGALATQTNAQTTSVAGTPTTLYTITYPANFFIDSGAFTYLMFMGKYAATANNKTTAISVGGTTIFTNTTATNDGTWRLEVWLTRGTTTNMKANCLLSVSTADINTSAAAGVTVTGTGYDALAVADLTTTALVVNLVATDAVAAGGTTAFGFVANTVNHT